MIKKYILLPLLLIAATFVYAQPQRQVLLTLKKGEILYYAEYASNMRINGHKFTCILNDTLSDKKIFIHNGERKVTAAGISIYNINTDDFNKCVFKYDININGTLQHYLSVYGVNYGPYEYIYYYNYETNKCNYSGQTNIDYALPHEFRFWLMGEKYYHYEDGSILNEKETKYEYQSPNKQHKIHIDNSRRFVTLDDKKYIIPIPTDGVFPTYEDFPTDGDFSKFNPRVCLFDDGTCFYEQTCQMDPKNKYDTETFQFFITPTAIKQLTAGKEYYDFDKHQVLPCKKDADYSGSIDYMGWDYEGIGWDYKNNQPVTAYNFTLQDKSKRHLFIANWKYDYVLIDGKKYGKHCPIDAFYDKDANAFAWTTIEGHEIVLYTFDLN